MHEKLTSYSGCGIVHCRITLYRPGMFEPIDTTPDRARVRLRDLGAAWVLVALLLLAGVLPGTLRAAKTEAIRAAGAARSEVASVLHAVPKLLLRSPQA